MSTRQDLRIVFAGTPAFAVPALEALIGAGFRPVAVLTQPDRPAGRGRHLSHGPVKRAAQARDLPVLQPCTLSDEAMLHPLRELHPDLLVVVAYGLILPAAVLDLPAHGCWNIHASLLPRWRGAAPIQRAIEAGDTETGVSIMQMDAGLDTGPVLLQRATFVRPDDTGDSLHDRLAVLGAEALLECLGQLAAGHLLPARPQPAVGVSYARKLDKAEARIDWSRAAVELERRIRAFVSWPICWCEIGGERTRVWSASVVSSPAEAAPGTILSHGPRGIDVATGDGVLRLLRLQPSGGRPMDVAEYLRARRLPARLDPGT